MNLIQHYRTLWHYLRHRYEGDEYDGMRTYFAALLVEDLRLDFGISLRNLEVLEVGGSSGRFSAYFSETCRARCVNVEIEDMRRVPDRFVTTIQADGTSLPVRSESFDLVLSRGVIEHVPRERQLALVQECYRALKPGGHCLINTQPWYAPFAGHQLRPFHILPFAIAKLLSNLAKSSHIEGDSLEEIDPPLYPITMRRLHSMVQDAGFTVLGTKDYHFRMHFVTKLPWLREVLTQSISYVLQKEPNGALSVRAA